MDNSRLIITIVDKMSGWFQFQPASRSILSACIKANYVALFDLKLSRSWGNGFIYTSIYSFVDDNKFFLKKWHFGLKNNATI